MKTHEYQIKQTLPKASKNHVLFKIFKHYLFKKNCLYMKNEDEQKLEKTKIQLR